MVAEGVEKLGPAFGAELADVFDGAQGAADAMAQFAGEDLFICAKVRIGDLHLRDLVRVSGRNPASGRTAWFFFENMNAVILPGEIEQAVREIGNERAFVNAQAAESRMTVEFGVGALPEKLARIGHHPAADQEVWHVGIHHTAGDEVQLHIADRVPGIRPAVDFHHRGHGLGVPGAFAEFVNDFENEPPLAFVPGGDSGVGNEEAGKRG